FSLNLMTIALELARTDPVYEDIATKFFEHFLYIAGALNNLGGDGIALWDDRDEFFYDILHHPGDHRACAAREGAELQEPAGVVPQAPRGSRRPGVALVRSRRRRAPPDRPGA